MKPYYIESPENAAKFSDSFVNAAKNITGQVLDYSPDSLAILESIIDSFRSDGAPSDRISDTLFSMGCYLGEVFVRNGCGTWVPSGNTPLKDFCSVALIVRTGLSSLCNPIDKVAKRFENGAEESLTFFYSRFAAEAAPSTSSIAFDIPDQNASSTHKESSNVIQRLLHEAEKGSASAQYQLAERYQEGDGVERDYTQCVFWYTQAAAQGDGIAINNLADKYEHGLGAAQDLSKALALYLEAADKNVVAAWYSLGLMYYDGRGVERDLQQAIKWMQKAASLVGGFLDAKEQLGRMEREHALQTIEEGKAVLARANEFNSTTLYEEALRMPIVEHPESMPLAAKLYQQAAVKGHPHAQYQLAWCFEHGRGLEVDVAEALKWYQVSAKQEDVAALTRLGEIYASGAIVPQDKDKASKFIQQAAIAEWTQEAEYWLSKAPWAKGADLFGFAKSLKHPDVPQAINMAFHLYLRAAEVGYRDAQVVVAQWYEAGKGVSRDKQEARRWWRQAADQGHALAIRKTRWFFWKLW